MLYAKCRGDAVHLGDGRHGTPRRAARPRHQPRPGRDRPHDRPAAPRGAGPIRQCRALARTAQGHVVRPRRDAATTHEIAWMAALLASDKSAYTTGTIVTVDGGGTAATRRSILGEMGSTAWNWDCAEGRRW